VAAIFADPFPSTTVPEPGSLVMLLSGIAGLSLLRRRRSPAAG
jgi:hypothetical protein